MKIDKITNLKCPDCDNGIIVLRMKGLKAGITFEVKPCNCCKAFYGLKACKDLKAIHA